MHDVGFFLLLTIFCWIVMDSPLYLTNNIHTHIIHFHGVILFVTFCFVFFFLFYFLCERVSESVLWNSSCFAQGNGQKITRATKLTKTASIAIIKTFQKNVQTWRRKKQKKKYNFTSRHNRYHPYHSYLQIQKLIRKSSQMLKFFVFIRLVYIH